MNPAPVTTPEVGPLRLATRRSDLAMAQSRSIGEQLAALTGRELELVEVTTQGDIDLAPLTQIGGTGVFVVAVRQAVIDGRADVAVHSLKDLPTTPDPRLALAAIPPREDPRDVLVAGGGATLSGLPVGARVGTGSPRRRSQIAALRPDLELVEIRGNVGTRIARVVGRGDGTADGPADGPPDGPPDGEAAPGGDLDAVVLAAAGLVRLGRQDEITELIDPDRVLPAPGQGALAVEVRAEVLEGADSSLAAALHTLDDPGTRAAVDAERALLAALEAGCSAPVGALAQVEPGAVAALHLRAVMARPDGSLVRGATSGPATEARALGHRLADELLAEARTTAQPDLPAEDRIPVTGSITAHRGSSE